jgi:uncharacterized protein (TIGR03032 family)
MADCFVTDATVATAQEDWSAQHKLRTGFEVSHSSGFPAWLALLDVSLAVTTYQTGKLILIGRQPAGNILACARSYYSPMGLWSDGQTIWMGSQEYLWRFENVLPPGLLQDGFDRVYVPRLAHMTGYLDVHDVAVDGSGRVVFVNSLFSCLATVSDRFSFQPLWMPSFVTELATEDRCHLNGAALEQGRPRYVTAAGRSNVAEGWRAHREDGGVVIDVQSNDIVADGLSMPHSPRMHQGRLWLLNSGAGQLGYVDLTRGTFEPVAFCPGYVRGLAFVDRYAVVGLSKPRYKDFSGLPLDGHLAVHNRQPACGVYVIDVVSGRTIESLEFEGQVTELYDVCVLPSVRRPKVLGFHVGGELRRTLSADQWGEL